MPSVISNVPAFLRKLFFWKAVLYIVGVISTSALGSLAGMQWSNSDNQTRLMVIISIAGTSALTLKAFIDDTAQKVARGESPFAEIPNDPLAPGMIQKTVIAQVETKTTTTP